MSILVKALDKAWCGTNDTAVYPDNLVIRATVLIESGNVHLSLFCKSSGLIYQPEDATCEHGRRGTVDR